MLGKFVKIIKASYLTPLSFIGTFYSLHKAYLFPYLLSLDPWADSELDPVTLIFGFNDNFGFITLDLWDLSTGSPFHLGVAGINLTLLIYVLISGLCLLMLEIQRRNRKHKKWPCQN